MRVETTNIDGAFIFTPNIYGDQRGYFFESFNQREFEQYVPRVTFIQDNQSFSVKNVLRGLHFQKEPYSQSKLVRCTQGRVLDVAVDLRKHSPTYKQWCSVVLDSEEHNQFFIPRGCAHGFAVLSDEATFQYKCDCYYHPEAEDGINAFDPQFNIYWGIPQYKAIMTDKDKNRPNYSE